MKKWFLIAVLAASLTACDGGSFLPPSATVRCYSNGIEVIRHEGASVQYDGVSGMVWTKDGRKYSSSAGMGCITESEVK